MLSLRPQFEAMGFNLIVVSLGDPTTGGKEFCQGLPFPPDLLYLDPKQAVYKSLSLYSMNLFMGMDFINSTMDGFKKKDMKEFQETLSRPPNVDITLQLGGTYVVAGDKLLFGHMEKGIGAHADNADVLKAVAGGVALLV
eukprot:gene32374-5409_t